MNKVLLFKDFTCDSNQVTIFIFPKDMLVDPEVIEFSLTPERKKILMHLLGYDGGGVYGSETDDRGKKILYLLQYPILKHKAVRTAFKRFYIDHDLDRLVEELRTYLIAYQLKP